MEALRANPEVLGSTFELEDKLDVAWFAGRLEDAHAMEAFRDGELVGTAGFSIQQGQKNAHKAAEYPIGAHVGHAPQIGRAGSFNRQ